jgi:hypothetical protein
MLTFAARSGIFACFFFRGAIINPMVAAEYMTGHKGFTAPF